MGSDIYDWKRLAGVRLGMLNSQSASMAGQQRKIRAQSREIGRLTKGLDDARLLERMLREKVRILSAPRRVADVQSPGHLPLPGHHVGSLMSMYEQRNAHQAHFDKENRTVDCTSDDAPHLDGPTFVAEDRLQDVLPAFRREAFTRYLGIPADYLPPKLQPPVQVNPVRVLSHDLAPEWSAEPKEACPCDNPFGCADCADVDDWALCAEPFANIKPLLCACCNLFPCIHVSPAGQSPDVPVPAGETLSPPPAVDPIAEVNPAGGAVEEYSPTLTPHDDCYVHDYESPDGAQGFRACCPSLPGCVVRHGNRSQAMRMVALASEAVESEKEYITKLPMAWSKP